MSRPPYEFAEFEKLPAVQPNPIILEAVFTCLRIKKPPPQPCAMTKTGISLPPAAPERLVIAVGDVLGAVVALTIEKLVEAWAV